MSSGNPVSTQLQTSDPERASAGTPFEDFAPRHASPLGVQERAQNERFVPIAAPASAEQRADGVPAPGGTAGPPGAAPGDSGEATRSDVGRDAVLRAVVAGEWPHHQPEAGEPGWVASAVEPAERRVAFVLHAHLPWVLGHGRWPHGEDWLAEAVVHCYLPLACALWRLAARGGRHLLTVSISPVLAAQLGDPRTTPLVSDYLAHRREAARALATEHPLAGWWEATYDALLAQWADIGHDPLGAFSALAERGVIELSTCAATHGYLPLLHRREHVALQLAAARHNHRRWFGRAPAGLWMPECAYRPGGRWSHPATGASEAERPGNEDFLAAAGVRWTVVDAHLLLGGEPLAPYPALWGAADGGGRPRPLPLVARLQPQWIGDSSVAALPREPHTAHQVWSRHGGYPGDPRYLDFHKRHGDTGLRLWRVTDAAGDLGDKLPYHPGEAMEAVRDQARHFPELLAGIAGLGGGVAVCPYDAELFGHWWFEGVAWLEAVLAACLEGGPVTATTPSRELAQRSPGSRVALHEGSWGEEGDHRVWVSDATTWMWEDLRRAEEGVAAAMPALPPARARAVLAQLMLLGASDWPFLVTTGTAADYATERFEGHRERLWQLLADEPTAPLPAWASEDLAGMEIEPSWWSETLPGSEGTAEA